MENHRMDWKMRFKMATNAYLSIIALNVNGLNAPVKRHRSGRLDKKAKKRVIKTIKCGQGMLGSK